MSRTTADQSIYASDAPAMPGMVRVVGASPTQHQFNESVRTILETGLGARGSRFDRWMTQRDVDRRLSELGIAVPGLKVAPARGIPPEGVAIPVVDGHGRPSYLSIDAFTRQIEATKLFQELTRKIDDPARFAELPQRTRELLQEDLGLLAQRLGADVRRLDEKIQGEAESFAQSVTSVTAAVAQASAGVRQAQFAYASLNRAVSGQVTTITARLNNFNGGGATVEQSMVAVADRATGLEARYTVKVTAGGAVAGYGLAATSNSSGNASSAFIIQADKFAIVSSSYAGGLTNSPSMANVPFGVDGSGVYINAPLFVNGTTGMSLVSGGQVGRIKLDSSSNLIIEGTGANKSISLLAPLGGGLTVQDFDMFPLADQTSLIIKPPGGAGTVLIQSSVGDMTLQSAGGSLALRSGTVGANTMTLEAGGFAFTGTAKLVTATSALAAGNASGNVPVSNGTLNTNLNAEMVGGQTWAAIQGWVGNNYSPSGHTHASYATAASVAKALIYQSVSASAGAFQGYIIVATTDGVYSGIKIPYYAA